MNRGPGRLWTLRPDASGLTELPLPEGHGSGSYPVWSPDGTRIAASVTAGVIVIDPSSSPAKVVSQFSELGRDVSGSAGSDGMRPYAWSPDGRRLIGVTRFGLRNHVVVLDLETREYRVVSRDGVSPVWLPDSRRVLFAGPTSLVLLDTVSGTERRLMPLGREFDQWGRTVALSRDGRTLVYLQPQTEGDIWLMTINAADAR
jgi:Tol biopolymer transport system component